MVTHSAASTLNPSNRKLRLYSYEKFFEKKSSNIICTLLFLQLFFLRPNIFTPDFSTTYLRFYFFCFTSFSNPEGKIFLMGFTDLNNWFFVLWIYRLWTTRIVVSFHKIFIWKKLGRFLIFWIKNLVLLSNMTFYLQKHFKYTWHCYDPSKCLI